MVECKRATVVQDLTGQRFNRLTVEGRTQRAQGGRTAWVCRCDCGNQTTVLAKRLRSGETKSCGCLKAEVTAARNRTHGQAGTRIYKVWQGMVKRCTNPSYREFYKYGGRGIQVCERWKSFENFYADMADGYADHLTIDRIDVDGNYEPGNCRWATQTEQQRNRRNNLLITYEGSTKTLAEWCEQLGLPQKRIGRRLRSGWDVERAFNAPVRTAIRPPRPHPQG